MDGQSIEYNNNYNLYDYFKKITLNNEHVLVKNAIIYKEKRVKFVDLNQLIINLSNRLYTRIKSKLSSNRGETNIIGIHLKPDENTAAILLAIHRLECSYLPIDPLLPVKRIEYLIDDAGPLCIVTNVDKESSLNEALKTANGASNIELIHVNELLNETNCEDALSSINLRPEAVACVLYTSGSTGMPKGVCLAHSTIMNRLNWQWDTYPIDFDQEIVAFKTSLNFVDHLAEVFAFLLKGCTVVVVDSSSLANPNQLVNIVYENKITHFILVPSLLKNILNYVMTKKIVQKLNSLRRIVCSGETLTIDLVNLFFDANLKDAVLCNFYGSTEVMGDITYITLKSREQVGQLLHENTNVPLGVPISNSSIKLYDENLNEIKPESDEKQVKLGEIYASGLCLANGYLDKNKQLSEKDKGRFLVLDERRYFRTGDFGYIHNGLLYFSGRQDALIKIRGKRVDLGELEHNATKIEGIEQFIPLVFDPKEHVANQVTSWQKTSYKFIIAYYKVSNYLTHLDESEINSLIVRKLKLSIFDYMIPSFMLKLDYVPLLINGKIDKIKLKAQFAVKYNEMFASNNLKNNSSNLKDSLLNIIEMQTGISLVNKRSEEEYLNLTLSQLGLNSLNAIDVHLTIENLFRLNSFAFDEFLTCNTLNELIIKIKSKLDSDCSNENNHYSFDQFQHLKAIPFSENKEFAQIVLRFICETYPLRNDLCISFVDYEDTYQAYKALVEFLQDSPEAFIVYDTTKQKYVGGAFITALDKPLPYSNDGPNTRYIHTMLDELESEVIEKKGKGLKILSADLITTDVESTFQENVCIVNFIESHIVEVAKRFNYDAIITANSNKATQDSCWINNGYVIEKSICPNKYEINGKIQYKDLPDSCRVDICMKYLKS